jgi:4a-hydroxytetrahydrobiopterin dehydratase
MTNWLDTWHQDERGRLVSSPLKFDSFTQAIRFVNLVAAEAEAQRHHPEILINYDEVTIYLITHDIGMVSIKDYRLGEAIMGVYFDVVK